MDEPSLVNASLYDALTKSNLFFMSCFQGERPDWFLPLCKMLWARFAPRQNDAKVRKGRNVHSGLANFAAGDLENFSASS